MVPLASSVKRSFKHWRALKQQSITCQKTNGAMKIKTTYITIQIFMIFIADLIACSTCFRHHYAHHQELESLIEMVDASGIWCFDGHNGARNMLSKQ